jgi:5'(3')-deoxyribonucleotidase
MYNNVCFIDLDDTLGDLKSPMMHALNHATGKTIHWSLWKSFDVPKIYGLTDKEFLDILIDKNILETLEIHGDSYEFLKDLQDLDKHVVLITARGWHPDAQKITENWVINHGLEIDELIVVEQDQSKTDFIKRFGEIGYSLDDRIKHCREYMRTGLVGSVILCNAPWNNDMTKENPFIGGHDYHKRIYDLHEAIDHIKMIDNLETGVNVNAC